MVTTFGNKFDSTAVVDRMDLAVALVRALGHDAEARALAGTAITAGGTPLTDSDQVPASLRGYVQIAINNGMFEAFPAEVRQVGPGQYQALPGPRFEPFTPVNRATLAIKLEAFQQLFTTGG